MFYYSDGWLLFSPAPLFHLNQCATLTVPSVQTELVPICNKEHSMLGQSVRTCAHYVYVLMYLYFWAFSMWTLIHDGSIRIPCVFISICRHQHTPGHFCYSRAQHRRPYQCEWIQCPPASKQWAAHLWAHLHQRYSPLPRWANQSLHKMRKWDTLHLLSWDCCGHWYLQLAACTPGDLCMFDYSSGALDLKKNITLLPQYKFRMTVILNYFTWNRFKDGNTLNFTLSLHLFSDLNRRV